MKELKSMNQNQEQVDNPERRELFRRAAIGGGAVLVAGLGAYGVGRASIQGFKTDTWPQTNEDFLPMDQRNVLWNYTASREQAITQPERNYQFGVLNKNDPDYSFQIYRNSKKLPFDNNKVGFTQLDYALADASWGTVFGRDLKMNALCKPNTQMYSWDQSSKVDEQYKFASKEEATDAIRSAAKLFGAARVGIARQDKRWDYDPIINVDTTSKTNPKDEVLTWEEDFPFKPKTVIVLAVPMDYDSLAAGPTKTSSAATGDGYSKMALIASTMADFIRRLGYHAVASGNDLGNSVAYGIAAGLGEGARNGALVVPGYGPRIRLCKVYTDFDFVEYGEPHNWGIEEFCKTCMECAHKCPSKAITMADDTSFYFEGEHAEQPGYSWSNHEGIKKFHNDAKRCLDYWFESNTDCSACITSCTFNEPDYWHHWMIVSANPFVPSVLHEAMSKMHPAFGYGKTSDESAVKKFWQTGRGMRVNPTNRNTYGAVGRS
ncbi:reductive dehalogenase [Shewanella maritima]|uniref:reductive dehalogenase n=1 Tax=Shewanella maritima TaxID=2520507 RepID=UPI003736AB93